MNRSARLRSVAARVASWGPIATIRRVLDRYDAAGGGLLAGGLTYSALFALLPALLLITGVLGFLVDDPERRRAIVEGIGQALPPLRDFLAASLEQITSGAAGFGTLGLIGLAWGASRFYGSLDDAFARIFVNAPKRGFVERTLRGVVAVVVLVALFVASLALTGIASYLVEEASRRFGGATTSVWQFLSPGLTAALLVVGMAAVYRLVPAGQVPWRALLPPAILVGVAVAVVTQLFSLIAPRLIGAAAVYGTFVAVFAAMIWLATCFQLLLLGASWVGGRLGPAPSPGEAAIDEDLITAAGPS